MRTKDYTVRMSNIHPSITWAIFEIDYTVRNFLGYEGVITSGNDYDGHVEGSRHYSGMAFGLRTWTSETSGIQLSHETKVTFRDILFDLLGSNFRILVEDTHLHIEYRPNEPT